MIISVKHGYLGSVRQALLGHGDHIKGEHAFIDALSADIHTTDIPELARQPWVQSVSIDATVYAVGKDDDNKNKNKNNDDKKSGSGKTTTGSSSSPITEIPGTSPNSLRETLGLSVSAPTGKGSGVGVVVGVLDSGIAASLDLPESRIKFFDFTHGGPCVVDPTATCAATSPAIDDFGHGTHIAGLIGSNGFLADSTHKHYQGIAPEVTFVGIKVLDSIGSGLTSNVISAIEYLIHHPGLGVKVINLSMGHPIFAPARFDPLVQAIEQATAHGIVVVVAAGNDGQICKLDAATNLQTCTGPFYASINSPGNAPSAITVGAVDTKDTVTRGDDLVAPYSSRGPTWFDAIAKPDVVAAGHHLWSDATGVLAGTLGTTLWEKCAAAQASDPANPDFLAKSVRRQSRSSFG